MDADTMKSALMALPSDTKMAVAEWLRGGNDPAIETDLSDALTSAPDAMKSIVAEWLDQHIEV